MRADRLISLLLLLQTRGQMTARELADKLEVSERTIYRDLDALSVAGIPVYTERGPAGGISLLDDYRTSLTGLTEHEVSALFAAIVPDPAADLGANDALKQAVLKLTAALPARQQNQAELVRHRIHLDAGGWFQPYEPVPFLGLLQQAVWEQRRLRMVYRRGDGEWVRRLVSPYALVAKASIWYLVAAVTRPPDFGSAPAEPMMVVYRVSRIQEAELAESSFERWPGFDLPAYWDEWCRRFEDSQESFNARLRVHMDQIPLLVEAFGEGVHQLVAAAGSPDAQGNLCLTMTFSGMGEAVRQIIGLGTVVEVVEPPELRQQIKQMAQTVWLAYRDNGLTS
jgi:predicted DNA-binding transcriptional regulator YafY